MSTILVRPSSSSTNASLLKKLVLAVLIVAFGFFLMYLGAYIEGDSLALRHNESMAIAVLAASI